jgi:hypothetical protein
MSSTFDVSTPGFTSGDPVDLGFAHILISNFSVIFGTCSMNVLVCVSNTISTGGAVVELLPNV